VARWVQRRKQTFCDHRQPFLKKRTGTSGCSANRSLRKIGLTVIINRDYERNEADDFTLNVQPRLSNLTDAIPLYHEGFVVGWKMQSCYE
jgi:hypothetical protein